MFAARLGGLLIAAFFAVQFANCGDAKKSEVAARAVVERSIAALGGKDRVLLQLKSYTRTKAKANDGSVDIEEWMYGPERYRRSLVIDSMGKTTRLVEVTNGKTKWQKTNDEAVTTHLNGEGQVASSSVIANLARLLVPLLEPEHFALEMKDKVPTAKQDVYCVRVKSKGLPPLDLYFDSTTCFLAKYEYRSPSGVLKGKNVQHNFWDYRDLNGITYATRSKLLADGGMMFEDEVVELRLLNKSPEGVFDKP